MAIEITSRIRLDDNEISFTFVRASGPGGQNVNKVSTAVQMRFDLLNSPSLPEDLKERAARRAKHWLTGDGVILINAQRFRTQERNRQDAIDRLVAVLQAAAVRPVSRKPTRPTLASKSRTREGKIHRGGIKRLRQSRPDDGG